MSAATSSSVIVIVPSAEEVAALSEKRTCDKTKAVKVERSVPQNVLHECDPPPAKKRLRSMIHQAVIDGRLPFVRLLLNKMGESVNAKDIYGRTPLILSCLLENEAVALALVRLFVSRGASVNEVDAQGRTALHYACLGGRERVARQLLDEPGLRCVHDRDGYGFTALMYAAMRGGSPGIVSALVTDGYDGASVDERDELGYTALMLAARCGNFTEASILVTDGAAQTTLRDNEYRRTAAEWANCYAAKARTVQPRRPRPRSTQAPCNMYATFKPFRCQHQPKSGKLSCSGYVTRGLPDMFQQQATSPSSSSPAAGQAAVSHDQLIGQLQADRGLQFPDLAAILAAPLQREGGPVDPAANLLSASTSGVRLPPLQLSASAESVAAPPPAPASAPTTPQLISVRHTSALMVPDLCTLFRLYLPDNTKPDDAAIDNQLPLPIVNIIASDMSNRPLATPSPK